MKKSVAIVLSIVAGGLMLGCQETVIQGPEPGMFEAVTDKPAPSNVQIISINGVVSEPGAAEGAYEVSGEARCVLSEVGGLGGACQNASVYLSTSGTITSAESGRESSLWSFEGESNDIICLTYAGSTLEKSYFLQGRSDGASLHILFDVNGDQLKPRAMWLHVPDAAD
jgi:hypothetical protein